MAAACMTFNYLGCWHFAALFKIIKISWSLQSYCHEDLVSMQQQHFSQFTKVKEQLTESISWLALALV